MWYQTPISTKKIARSLDFWSLFGSKNKRNGIGKEKTKFSKLFLRFRALLVCIVECIFGLIGFSFNFLHFVINIWNCMTLGMPIFIFLCTMLQYSVFFSFKVSSPYYYRFYGVQAPHFYSQLEKKHHVLEVALSPKEALFFLSVGYF